MEGEYTAPDILSITLKFRVAGKEHSYSRDILLPHTPTEDGIAIAATDTFAEFEK